MAVVKRVAEHVHFPQRAFNVLDGPGMGSPWGSQGCGASQASERYGRCQLCGLCHPLRWADVQRRQDASNARSHQFCSARVLETLTRKVRTISPQKPACLNRLARLCTAILCAKLVPLEPHPGVSPRSLVTRAKEKAPNNIRRSGLTLNEAASLQAAAKFLPGLLYRYTLLRGFPWGLAYIRHRTNATWIW
jgi:hypothetical protein